MWVSVNDLLWVKLSRVLGWLWTGSPSPASCLAIPTRVPRLQGPSWGISAGSTWATVDAQATLPLLPSKRHQDQEFGEEKPETQDGCNADGWPGRSHGTTAPPGPGFRHGVETLCCTRPRWPYRAAHGWRAPQNHPPIARSPSSALPFPISWAPLRGRRMLGKRCVCGSRARHAASPSRAASALAILGMGSHGRAGDTSGDRQG